MYEASVLYLVGLSNVGGVAVARKTGDVYLAGSDYHGVAVVRGAAAGRSVNSKQLAVDHVEYLSDFEHPYSVAVNPATGDVIVGDDHMQTVYTSNLSRAHVTGDSVGAATWKISVQLQRARK